MVEVNGVAEEHAVVWLMVATNLNFLECSLVKIIARVYEVERVLNSTYT